MTTVRPAKLDLATFVARLTFRIEELEREGDALRDELLRVLDRLTPKARARYVTDRERRGGPSP